MQFAGERDLLVILQQCPKFPDPGYSWMLDLEGAIFCCSTPVYMYPVFKSV